MKFKNSLIILILFISLSSRAQETINLYLGSIPNSKGMSSNESGDNSNPGLIRKVTNPTLEVYLPEKDQNTGAAVIICPGGAYGVIVYQGEGIGSAKEFARNGITAFVLKYRLPNDSTMIDKKIGPLQDTQQAIKIVRENAAKWGIDPNKIGIVGFSAGGHLASTAATHFNKALIENENGTSLRPDFQILVYPVISMQDKLTHLDSRKNLLGAEPSKETIDLFSNELQVDKTTPPAYITHAADDKLVDIDNSIEYFEKLRHNNVPVEMHVYSKGGHGFIFANREWTKPMLQWMIDSKLINKK